MPKRSKERLLAGEHCATLPHVSYHYVGGEGDSASIKRPDVQVMHRGNPLNPSYCPFHLG